MTIFPTKFFTNVFLGFSLLSTAGTLQAFTIDDYFSGQRQIYTAKNPDTTYRLTLSSLKKINGEWLAEKEMLVRGNLTRVSLEISRPYKFDTAKLALQAQFNALNASLVYACEGMACGSSNAWANERFEVKQLYGLDLSQYYQVWQFKDQGLNKFAAVYLVQRGNKRVYSQLDIIVPKKQNLAFAPSAGVIAKQFYRDKQITVSGLKFEQGNIQINQENLKSYAQAFNQQAFRNLLIVGHDFFPGSEDEQETRSLAYANAVKDALVRQGVQEKRIQVKGIGALAPEAGNDTIKQAVEARVVVLLK
ncbi:MAG: DUF4892 domain-containing protein [Agarilytica sp.]